MSDFASHLSFLAESHSETLQNDIKLLLSNFEEWEREAAKAKRLDLPDATLTLDQDPKIRTVLDLHKEDSTPVDASGTAPSVDNVISRLTSEQQLRPLLHNLSVLLLSNESDDSVSRQIVDLLGVEEIELALSIMSNRQAVGDELTKASSVSNREPLGTGTSEKHGKQKKKGRANDEGEKKFSLTQLDVKKNMEASLRAAESRPLFSGTAQPNSIDDLPHIYTVTPLGSGNLLSSNRSKYILPVGTTRHHSEEYEEVVIPPAKPVPRRTSERLITVKELDTLCQGSFPGYQALNRIQSIVYQTAYKTNENMLVCAPTGAGKTDVAMLTILHTLRDYLPNPLPEVSKLASSIKRDDFKIIYVAPMKALASEIVTKFARRLQWLSIKVRELTGDMQMTKAEIAQTQIIVTTPEKWDVVTRMPTGEGDLASKVKLLIIDEVHLLNEDRGAVIETIVARTLRQVEATQSMIRVVGLSATLPNFIDVADFLGVSRKNGLFFFDSSFRPIPLEQHFLGIKGKPGSPQSRKNLDRTTFEKVSALVRDGHQVMVFVHARKETVKAALALKEAAVAEGSLEEFSCQDHPSWQRFRHDIGKSHNREMKELFENGFGIHHAGMLRSDRDMTERIFRERAIKVLFCTATLAWGVNLPAHAVIIKGTQLYDKGKFTDLSVLDVLQIFGRAGRPGLESSGEGYICTTEDKLDHYLGVVTAQNPIESQFQRGMVDSLNAEIFLGTVANISEAVRWLGYTYLFVRMRKNPRAYGITDAEREEDEFLGSRRLDLVKDAARTLAKNKMIQFNEGEGSLSITDLGRIAAKYYIRHSTIEIFNEKLRPDMSEADVLVAISRSTEFDQIQVRENEVEELMKLMQDEDVVPCQLRPKHPSSTDLEGEALTSPDKVNILLQCYISNVSPEDFALILDSIYVAQNGGRIIRALLEIALSRKWAVSSAALIAMSKAIEHKLWPFQNPMKQFSRLSRDVQYGLTRFADDLAPTDLASYTAAELGELIHLNEIHGAALLKAIRQFPTAFISNKLRPLSADLLRISIKIAPSFEWDSKIHHSTEPFWLWVEDHTGVDILQMAYMQFRQNMEELDIDFVVSVHASQIPPSMRIRFLSDRWLGAEQEVLVSLNDLVMPIPIIPHTSILNLPYLRSSVLGQKDILPLYLRQSGSLNAIQTQCFWSVYHSTRNIIVSAPSSSGKSLLGQFALWSSIEKRASDGWFLLVTLRRDSARDLASSLRSSVARGYSVKVEFMQSPANFPSSRRQTVIVTTASCLLSALSLRTVREALPTLRVVVADDLEALDSEYELAISLLVHSTQTYPVRFIGLCASINDPADLASWLRVPVEGVYCFRPTHREQALATKFHTFTIRHSSALLKSMVKPAYKIIRTANQPAILFVPSRSQCRNVVSDITTILAVEGSDKFLGHSMTENDIEMLITSLKDSTLADGLQIGVGVYHNAMDRSDRTLILRLFGEGIIRVLVVPRESCWSLPVRAGVVVVMSTQYVRINSETGQRQTCDYSLQELVHMQGRAILHTGEPSTFHLMCQAEHSELFKRFLEEGLPLESELKGSKTLASWLQTKRKDGSIAGKQDAVDALSFTFLARRLQTNPLYYDARKGQRDEALSRLVDEIWDEVPVSVAA